MHFHSRLFAVALAGFTACGSPEDFASTDALAQVEQGLTPVSASFDTALRVPRCTTTGSSCSSGTLLTGRALLGPEPQAPNVRGTCADGTAGTYHVDESVDALTVTSVDGSPFTPGKTVRIDATVWAYTGYTSDKLDLYFTADAQAATPVWSFLATLTPPGAGLRTLSATYVLPSGGVQAVRAQFRYGGLASPCTSGVYNDRDDLAFSVGAVLDATPPSAGISNVLPGSTVAGVVPVHVVGSDNVGVSRVELLVDGVLASSSPSFSLDFAWNSASVANGTHTLTARAFDAAGNQGSSNVSITVANTNATELVVNGGFEGGSSPWALSGTSYSATGSPVHGGTGHLIFHPVQNSGSHTASQIITVPAGGATLTFWWAVQRVGTQSGAQDTLQVDLVPTDGSTSNSLAFGGTSFATPTGYVQQSISLASMAGKTVTIRFVATSYSDWSAFDPTWGVYFHLDDVSVR